MLGAGFKNLPYIILGIGSLGLVGMAFLTIFVAAAFGGMGGSGGSTAPDDGGGSLAGDCDYKKILSAASAGQAEGQRIANDAATRKVPAKFIPIYTKVSASKKLGGCGPSIMAATHSIESAFADTGYSDVNFAGAGGPWQFLSGSWEAFGAQCNEGGSRSWPGYSVENGACAAANHWISGGAPKDWHAGIYSYNHAEWYVYGIASLAETYAKENGGQLSADQPDSRAENPDNDQRDNQTGENR